MTFRGKEISVPFEKIEAIYDRCTNAEGFDGDMATVYLQIRKYKGKERLVSARVVYEVEPDPVIDEIKIEL